MKLCIEITFLSTASTNSRIAAEEIPCDSGELRGKLVTAGGSAASNGQVIPQKNVAQYSAVAKRVRIMGADSRLKEGCPSRAPRELPPSVKLTPVLRPNKNPRRRIALPSMI
jgi:hypothetical protein